MNGSLSFLLSCLPLHIRMQCIIQRRSTVPSNATSQSSAAVGPDLVDEIHACRDQRVHLALALKEVLGQRPVPVEPADVAWQKVKRLPPPLRVQAVNAVTAAACLPTRLSAQRSASAWHCSNHSWTDTSSPGRHHPGIPSYETPAACTEPACWLSLPRLQCDMPLQGKWSSGMVLRQHVAKARLHLKMPTRSAAVGNSSCFVRHSSNSHGRVRAPRPVSTARHSLCCSRLSACAPQWGTCVSTTSSLEEQALHYSTSIPCVHDRCAMMMLYNIRICHLKQRQHIAVADDGHRRCARDTGDEVPVGRLVVALLLGAPVDQHRRGARRLQSRYHLRAWPCDGHGSSKFLLRLLSAQWTLKLGGCVLLLTLSTLIFDAETPMRILTVLRVH